MAITQLNNRSINRSDTAASGERWTATSATASDFQAAGGITVAGDWRITAEHSNMDNGDHVTSNWEEDDTEYSRIGSAMTQSSGIFTFPSTGIYYIRADFSFKDATEQAHMGGGITVTTDDSSYSTRSEIYTHLKLINDGNTYGHVSTAMMLDVTDTANTKVRLAVFCENNNINLNGHTDNKQTGIMFLRLGDT